MLRARLLLAAFATAACAAPEPAPPPAEDIPAPAAVDPSGPEAVAEEPPPAREVPAPPPPTPPIPGDSKGRQRDLEQRLMDATRESDYERADRLIGQLKELRIESSIQEVRRLIRAGDPEAALAVAEVGLAEVPNGPGIRAVHGEAALQVGLRHGDTELLEAALESFLGAFREPPKGVSRESRTYFKVHALQRAVLAARALGRTEEALAHARVEMSVAGEADNGRKLRLELPEWPEITFSESCFAVYVGIREEDPERAGQLAADLELVLGRLMVKRSRDPWAWSMLARTYVLEERFQDAIDVAEAGLGRFPEQVDLAGHLADAARGAGGSTKVLSVFARFGDRYPESPIAWWYPAWERFDRTVSTPEGAPRWYPSGGKLEVPRSELEPLWKEELELAQASFRRCRELEPAYRESCLFYEALCRSALGWIQLAEGDPTAARAAFRSMEDLFPGGMARGLDGVLLSGVPGLAFVGDALVNRDELARAAEVLEELRLYAPDNPGYANDAGFWNREAGTRMRVWSEDAARMARGDLRDRRRVLELLEAAKLEPPPIEREDLYRAALETAAERLQERARELFETSYAAYLQASELAPGDVRVVNDTALVAVYHLGRDLERAEDYLLRCVELGQVQLETRELDDEARLALTEAWGDAHQNLGVLYFDFKDDPEAARGWFEKSLEIGPYPRPLVTEDYLPRCE